MKRTRSLTVHDEQVLDYLLRTAYLRELSLEMLEAESLRFQLMGERVLSKASGSARRSRSKSSPRPIHCE